jgi:hypothetical protein
LDLEGPNSVAALSSLCAVAAVNSVSKESRRLETKVLTVIGPARPSNEWDVNAYFENEMAPKYGVALRELCGVCGNVVAEYSEDDIRRGNTWQCARCGALNKD